MIGLNDLIEYWSAAALFLSNEDFYDPALMAPIQQQQGFAASPPLMMWLPPWALLWLLPLLRTSFISSAQLWAAVSVSALCVTAVLWMEILDLPQSRRPFLVLASLLFVPSLSTLIVGQVSILLFFQVTVALWLLSRRHDFFAGVFFLSLTWKAHLFLVAGPVLAWWILQQRRYLVPLGFIAALCASVACCYWIAPDSLEFWFSSLTESKPGAPQKLAWITPTLVGMSRPLFGEQLHWIPLACIPAFVLVVTLAYFIIRTREFGAQDLSFVLCLSYCFAPFAWIFDAVLLLPSYLTLCSLALQRFRRRMVMPLIAASQLLIILAHGLYLNSHHSFIWFPLLLLAVESVRYFSVAAGGALRTA